MAWKNNYRSQFLLNPENIKKLINWINVSFLSFGILAGIIAAHFLYLNSIPQVSAVREKHDDYAFINPLFFYDGPSNTRDYGSLVGDINNLINTFKIKSRNANVSVYFRNLNRGQWVGVNENEEYNPASMLKIVIMMAYFNKAQDNPSFLKQGIRFSSEINNLIGQIPFDHGTILELNKIYTAEELMEKMIINSDNGAAYALLSRIDDVTLHEAYSDLNISDPENKGRDYKISAKNYSSFLRLLFNATYINRNLSEKALSLLARSDFNEGLIAGLPADVNVAHKYGESITVNSSGGISGVELHDCGIIYLPYNPYILCIMTRGSDINDSKDVIKGISKAAYTYMKNSNR
jgi:beta-lactamase class A